MSSVKDTSGKVISHVADDAGLKHEPTRRSLEDAKRGGRDGKAGPRLNEITNRGSTPRRPRRQTGNDKIQRPMPGNDHSPEDMDQ